MLEPEDAMGGPVQTRALPLMVDVSLTARSLEVDEIPEGCLVLPAQVRSDPIDRQLVKVTSGGDRCG